MTDVRLTATNPEDSSVVPVACNSRGELLVTEPVIEQIDNNVTIAGDLTVSTIRQNGTPGAWWMQQSGEFSLKWNDYAENSLYLSALGDTTLRRLDQGPNHRFMACHAYAPLMIGTEQDTYKFLVDWNGIAQAKEFVVMQEPSRATNFLKSEGVNEDGEAEIRYTGPGINVGEELVFLRAQVKALMEKLNMTPEGGWPVWDGSTET